MEIGRKSDKGPRRKFGPFHYFRALELICASGRIGRARLAEELGIGEGSMRTVLDELESRTLIERDNSGISATTGGKRVVSSSPVRMAPISSCSLSLAGHSSVAVVRGASKRVTNGILQRDEAVRNEGTGATTLIVKNGSLCIPPEMKQVRDAELEKTVFATLHAADGDAVVVGSGRTAFLSDIAVFAAAVTLS